MYRKTTMLALTSLLAGQAMAAQFVVSESRNFPPAPAVGKPSPSLVTVKLLNIGSAGSMISPTLGGYNPGDFSVAANSCADIAVNGGCQISFGFTPSAAGTRSATVMLGATLITLYGTSNSGIGNGFSRSGACASGAASGCASFSSGTLQVTASGSAAVAANVCKSSGKWYFEMTPTQLSGNAASRALLAGWATNPPGPQLTGNGITGSGTYAVENDQAWGIGSTRTAETLINKTAIAKLAPIGYAFDADAGTLSVYNGGKAPYAVIYTGMARGNYCPAALATGALYNNTSSGAFNFGGSNFAYPVPAGFHAGVW
ncbi:hypothetical protein [Chromobacterium alticapitis]|uniref:B30.2/SPRY domain-containing protein n=1 Tax=Chromobacterium alticapitis TaxID=2073169 RepID=A0A2S5DIU4_9NEIS|nr:hypothetical protein [Chromobacterium alticapitis]POZ62964.1 hypothetical protein C2I19_03910 [Chromobacterium alticapitis]